MPRVGKNNGAKSTNNTDLNFILHEVSNHRKGWGNSCIQGQRFLVADIDLLQAQTLLSVLIMEDTYQRINTPN